MREPQRQREGGLPERNMLTQSRNSPRLDVQSTKLNQLNMDSCDSSIPSQVELTVVCEYLRCANRILAIRSCLPLRVLENGIG